MTITANRILALFLLFVAAGISYAVGFVGGVWATLRVWFVSTAEVTQETRHVVAAGV